MRPGFPVTTPFDSRDAVEEYLKDERLTCLLCGRRFKSLGQHVVRLHGWTVREYQEYYALPLSESLACEQTQAAYSEGTQKDAEWMRQIRALRETDGAYAKGSSAFKRNIASMHRRGGAPPHALVCRTCGKPFESKFKEQIYCSRTCSMKGVWNSGKLNERDNTGHGKLTVQQVADIRKRLARGEGVSAIANHYGVTPGTISHIKHGRSHKRARKPLSAP